jgi:DNA-binding GntR family transcriptional regulator
MSKGPFPEAVSVRRSSTAEQVAEAISDLVLQGRVEPGSRLREHALAETFGISRNTVRETLRLLERQGLVRHHRHRGVTVSDLGEQDVADLYRVRRILEPAGVSAARRAGPAAHDALRESLARLESAYSGSDWPQVVEADIAFHAGIVGLVESPRLDATFEAVASEMRFALAILSIVSAEHRDPGPLLQQHRAIFDAIAARRVRDATRLVVEHLDLNERRLRTIVRERPAAGAAAQDAG